MTSNIFVQALEKTGIREDAEMAKLFVNLVDLVLQIEPYTLFTSRTMSEVEGQIFADMEFVSFVISINMFLEGLMKVEENNVHLIIEGMFGSSQVVDFKENSSLFSLTNRFLSQLEVTDKKATTLLVMNTWYKVIILLVYYTPEVYDLIRQITSPAPKEAQK